MDVIITKVNISVWMEPMMSPSSQLTFLYLFTNVCRWVQSFLLIHYLPEWSSKWGVGNLKELTRFHCSIKQNFKNFYFHSRLASSLYFLFLWLVQCTIFLEMYVCIVEDACSKKFGKLLTYIMQCNVKWSHAVLSA